MQVAETLELSAVVWREERLYVALCPELDVASQGKSVEEALKNLKEALELYLEDEDVKRPMKAEAPIVTIVKVKVSGFTRNCVRESRETLAVRELAGGPLEEFLRREPDIFSIDDVNRCVGDCFE